MRTVVGKNKTDKVASGPGFMYDSKYQDIARRRNAPLVLCPVPIRGKYFAITSRGLFEVDLCSVNRMAGPRVVLPPPALKVWEDSGTRADPDGFICAYGDHYGITEQAAISRIKATADGFLKSPLSSRPTKGAWSVSYP